MRRSAAALPRASSAPGPRRGAAAAGPAVPFGRSARPGARGTGPDAPGAVPVPRVPVE